MGLNRKRLLFQIFMFIFFSFVILNFSPGSASADEFIGEYIKDHRDLDEIGLICTLEARKKTGGLVHIKITAENRALCGGTWEWEVPLKNNRALVVEESQKLEFRFQKNKVLVEGKTYENDHCPLTGTYILYGALVKPTPEIVQDIRRHYSYINNNLEKFDLVEKELSGFSTEGGTYKAYSYMEHPKKIVVEHLGEMGKVVEEYYFFDSRLLFSFRRTCKYDKPFGQVAGCLDDRYYFHFHHMIRWLDNDKNEISPQDKKYAAEEERVLLNSATYAGFVENDKKVIDQNDLKD